MGSLAQQFPHKLIPRRLLRRPLQPIPGNTRELAADAPCRQIEDALKQQADGLAVFPSCHEKTDMEYLLQPWVQAVMVK